MIVEGVPVVVGFSDLVEVGRGGFSRVFSAYQVEFDRRVALKVLNDRLADEASVGVFEGECRAMGTLSQHPFIVTVLASALTADYRPVIVMELFERGNYMQLLRRDGPLPLEELLSLSVRVGGALATAHHHGVIHGDVKPQNVLKSEFGFPALGDFGIATLRNRLSERAATGLSAHYAAPELIESGPTASGTTADQYSLAATIFTLATGRRPFEGTTPGEAPERVLARVLGSPTPRLPAPFPEELTNTLARAMSRDPQARFPDLGAFAFALTAVEHRLGYRATAVPLPGIDDDATITIDHPTHTQHHTTPPPRQPPSATPSPPPKPPATPPLYEPTAAQPPPSPDDPTIALPPPLPTTRPSTAHPRRRRLGLLVALAALLAIAGAVSYITLSPGDQTATSAPATPEPVPATADTTLQRPPTTTDVQTATTDAKAAIAEADPERATTQAETTPQPSPGPLESGGPFTLMVNGTAYALPGPAERVLGALSPDAVFPWTYDSSTGAFEAGDSPAAPFDPSIRAASQDYEIAWVSGLAESEWFQSLENSILGTAAASGVHVGVTCDSEFDPRKAVACAETVSRSDPDAVIFANWRSEAAEPSMEIFDDAGIPAITIDVWHPNAVLVGANNYMSGALAGLHTGLYALETWNCEGVHVLLAQTPVDSRRVDLPTSGFTDGVEAVCGDDVPVSRFDADVGWEEGIQATSDWLISNPGAEHVLATSLADLLAVSMSVAMEDAGRSGVAAGFTASQVSVGRIHEGPPEQTRYLGSVAHFPDLYGAYAVAALIDILDGRSVPQEIHIDPVWVNGQNVEEYYDTEGRPIQNREPKNGTPVTDASLRNMNTAAADRILVSLSPSRELG